MRVKIINISLATFTVLVMLTACIEKNQSAVYIPDAYKTQNHEYLRKIAFCRCLTQVDSTLKKEDHSVGVYFEKSGYGPEALQAIDSVVAKNKPVLKSFGDYKLGVAECISLYESDTLKKAIIKLDKYLAPHEE